MYVSSIVWQFKPGAVNRVETAIRDQLVPTARQIPGLRHLYGGPCGEDAWISVLVYDSQAQAEQGLATLAPAARSMMGDDIVNMQRQAAEAVIDEHFG